LSHLTQAELARRLSVHRSAVTQWEQVAGTTPSVQNLAQIAVETGVAFEWLATGRGPTRIEHGERDPDLIPKDFARDEFESNVLEAVRRVARSRRDLLRKVLEAFAG